MAAKNVEEFLASSPVARRARAEARLVLRRFTAPSTEVEAALRAGEVVVDAKPVCDLVVGDVVLAHGEILDENGMSVFRIREVRG